MGILTNSDIIEEVKKVLAIDYKSEDARIESLASSAIEDFLMMGIPTVKKGEKNFFTYCNLIARTLVPTLLENYAQSKFFIDKYNQDLARLKLYYEANPVTVEVNPLD